MTPPLNQSCREVFQRLDNAVLNSPLKIAAILIQQIEFELQQVSQWAKMRLFDEAATHMAALEALVEVMEIFDCGSTGGFGDGQGYEHLKKDEVHCNAYHRSQTIEERAQWQINKYASQKKRKK